MSRIRIRLLGTPEIHYGDQPLSFRTRKVLALFIYLTAAGGMHRREKLMALLWPETDARKGAVTLRATLSRLRRALRPAGEVLVAEGGQVGLDFGGTPDLDLARLAAAVDAAPSIAALAEILAIDRGEFLEGFSLPDAPEFDTWAATQREACQRQVEAAYDRLTGHLLADHHYPAAVEAAARWVARAPLHETAYRRLMTAQALSGRRSDALATYAQCRTVLAAELGISPAGVTTDLFERIQADRLAPAPAGSPADEPLRMPFVGRSEEHGRLAADFRRAVAEGARLCVVIGAGGVGKTRLLQAFREWVRLDTPEVDIWQGRAFETGGRLSYEPVIEALRVRLEQENAPEDLLEDVWLAELSQLMPELRGRYPDLPPPMTGDVSFVRSRLFAAIAALGNALAARRPVIFILDDVQWADPDSLGLVHYLARRWAESGAPILLLMTMRQENLATEAELGEWLTRLERDVPVTRLQLEPLSGPAVRQLIARLANPAAADDGASGAFADWLWVETNGLPFFVEARLRMLIEQGLLAGSELGFDFAAALRQVQSSSQMPLPPGVREIILARLARLAEVEEALLLAAAVVGRECSYERLCQVAAEDEESGLPALELLLKGRLLVEQGPARRPYSLAHDYIRTVVYDKSPAARRRIFHRRALIALEAASAPAAECAYHAVASLLDEPAFRHSLAAGEEAQARHALQECLFHCDQAREAAGRLDGDAFTTASWLRLYQKRGRALELSDRYEEARANYRELLTLAERRDDLVLKQAALTDLCILLARHTPVFDPPTARELGQVALALSAETGDRELEARALWGMMLVEFFTGGERQRVFSYGERSLALARELQLKEQMGFLLSSLTWAYILDLQLGAARRANEEALSVWGELGNLPMLVDTHLLRLVSLWVSGDFDGLLAGGPEALRLCRAIGHVGHVKEVLRLMGEIHGLQGRFGEALALLKEAKDAGRPGVDDPTGDHNYCVRMISFYLRCGAPEQAAVWADRLEAMKASFIPVFRLYNLAAVAMARIAGEDLAAAAAIVEEGFAFYNQEGAGSVMVGPLAVADGHLQLALGRPQAALERMQTTINTIRAGGGHLYLAEACWLRAKALLALGDLDGAQNALLEARQVAAAAGERSILWQILLTLIEVELMSGEEQAVEMYRQELHQVVAYIAGHAGSDERRAAFLARPGLERAVEGP